jgi:hypothetical protein
MYGRLTITPYCMEDTLYVGSYIVLLFAERKRPAIAEKKEAKAQVELAFFRKRKYCNSLLEVF